MFLDSLTAHELDWDTIRNYLAQFAQTSQGKEACLALAPQTHPNAVYLANERWLQLKQLLDQGINIPIQPIDNVDKDLLRATKGGVLNGKEVLRVSKAMVVSSRVRHFLIKQGDHVKSALVEIARGSHDLLDKGLKLFEAFEPDGSLRDSASYELKKLRGEVRSLSQLIRTRMEHIMCTSHIASCLSDSYISQCGERYVLPVRKDSRTQIKGIIHDTSKSGYTLFIEPACIIDDGNRLKIVRKAESDEEQRILSEYTNEIGRLADKIRNNLHTLAWADLVFASVQLGHAIDGCAIKVEGTGFDLKKARHPLMEIKGNKVVANDIRLPAGKRALVLSGPNAGGKTVTLKTLGLICIMAHAGLPVPVHKDSQIGFYTSLFLVIGDAQDLKCGLSTFSAHIQRIGCILKSASKGSLVLLDELVADTDPSQGGALGASILEELAGAGAIVLATTHYNELKLLAFHDDRFANASVGFDIDSMNPTFVLHPNLPGRSLALDIARKLGLSEKVLKRASFRVPKTELCVEEMLAILEKERKSIQVLKNQWQKQCEQARIPVQQHERATNELIPYKHEIEDKKTHELLAEITSARQEVAQIIESLRKCPDMRQAVASSHKLIELEKKIHNQLETSADVLTHPQKLHQGDRVRIERLKFEGIVTAIDEQAKKVCVQMGSMHARVPLVEVCVVQKTVGSLRQDSYKHRGYNADMGHITPNVRVEVQQKDNTLDIRGLHQEEGIREVDKFLDKLFTKEKHVAFIIHGHGSGALKTAVREYLRTSDYVRFFRAGLSKQGGDGVTVITLR